MRRCTRKQKRSRAPASSPNHSPYVALAIEVGRLVTAKQLQYGNSFEIAPKILRLLYPNGIQPNQYDDLLSIVRVLDKLKRVATRHSTDRENPWKDITGYGLLALDIERQHTRPSSNQGNANARGVLRVRPARRTDRKPGLLPDRQPIHTQGDPPPPRRPGRLGRGHRVARLAQKGRLLRAATRSPRRARRNR